MYPSNQDYKLALMIGADSFRTLENIEILSHPLYPTEPWFATGGLAIVFKIKYQGKLFALKCFTKESAERQERLLAISDYLKQNPNPYFVDFTYLENELWVENENGGEGYPVVLMKWVEGLTLDNYLKKVCANEDKPTLKRLYDNFGRLILWIQAQPIAHGDLKHDNILVMPDGQLKLIDYDGMYIPAFRGLKATELGSPCYQHPLRTAEYFNENLDDFSLIILQITLLAFETEPYLFFDHFNGDGLLFKSESFLEVEKFNIIGKNNKHLDVLLSLWRRACYSYEVVPTINLSFYLNIKKIILNDWGWILELIEDKKILNLIVILISGNYNFKSEDLIIKHKEKWAWNFNRPTYHSPKALYGLVANPNIQWSEKLIEIFRNEKWVITWENKEESSFLRKAFDTYYLTDYLKTPLIKEDLAKKANDYWDDMAKKLNWKWTIELIESLKIRINWDYISGNTEINFSKILLITFQNYFNWNILSRNKNILWSEDLIELFKDKLDWKYFSSIESNIFSKAFISKYQDYLDMEVLSQNKIIYRSEELIDYFKDRLDWKALSASEYIYWTEKLLIKFEDKFIWKDRPKINNIEWTVNIIERFKDMLDWNYFSEIVPNEIFIDLNISVYDKYWIYYILSSNKNILWTEKIINSLEKKIDWFELSKNENIQWTESLFKVYKNRWDWERLSYNKSIPFNSILIENFIHNWDWRGLSLNKKIRASEELLDLYKDLLDWDILSDFKWYGQFSDEIIDKFYFYWNWNMISMTIKWTDNLIDKYSEMLCPSYLCFRKDIKWTENLIEKHKDFWDFSSLIHNETVPWNNSLVSKYENYFDEKTCLGLKNFPWSETFYPNQFIVNRYNLPKRDFPLSVGLIEKFKDKLDWDYLSHSGNIKWTHGLIELYFDKWNWHRLSENESLPWSKDFILKYKAKWNWGRILETNEIVKNILLSNMDDELVDEFMLLS